MVWKQQPLRLSSVCVDDTGAMLRYWVFEDWLEAVMCFEQEQRFYKAAYGVSIRTSLTIAVR